MSLKRHQSRIIIIQSLYEIDFRNIDFNDFEIVLKHNSKEFAQIDIDFFYAKNTLDNILKKRDEIDVIIQKVATEWPIEKMSIVDRNILRLGIYELLYGDTKEVPAKVAINEAIEIAKLFSGEVSGKFINGVMGTVFSELQSQNKNVENLEKKDDKFISKKEKKRREIEQMTEEEKDKLPKEILVGNIVYSKENNNVYIALVHDIFGFWTLCKGKINEGEGLKDASKRKVKEELGIESVYEKDIEKQSYIATHPDYPFIKKEVHYALVKANFEKIVSQKTGGIQDSAWFKIEDIFSLKLYEDVIHIIEKAIAEIEK